MRTRYGIIATFLALSLGIFGVGCDSSTDNGELVASFEVETTNSTANFRDRSRYPDGEIESRTWEFGDGETANGQGVEHTYDEPGTYTVTLTVEGADGTTQSTSRDVSIGTQRFEVVVENTGPLLPLTKNGTFRQDGAFDSEIDPGEEAEFAFTVGPEELPETGTAFSFASRFDPSTDAFYAFRPEGIPLFDESGTPRGLDGPVSVTDNIRLWDAGTENAGDKIVEITDDNDDGTLEEDGTTYPAVSDVVEVTIEGQEDQRSGGYEFTVTIQNISDQTGATAENGDPIELSRGTYAAHFDRVPGGDPDDNPEDDVRYPGFITLDDSTASAGLATLAQNGNPADHDAELDAAQGISVPLSPGAFAAHSDAIQPFSLNREASEGIERIAEDGLPATLAETLGEADAVTDGGTFGNGPLPPTPTDAENEQITFTVNASPPSKEAPGDRLSIVTMHVQSNDYFYAFKPAGLPLFDDNGDPIDGTQTAELSLYDARTEADQELGVGINQAPRQPSSDAGPSQDGTVDRLTSNIGASPLTDVIEVTVTPVSQ